MQIFLFLALILMGITIIFAVQNTSTTMVRFLTWQTEGSLALVLLIAAAAGALISFFFSLPTLVRDKWTVRSQRKRLNELETEIDQQNSRMQDSEKRLAEYEEASHIEESAAEERHPENKQPDEGSPVQSEE